MRRFHLHLISDSTGETAGSVARAAISQFDDAEPVQHSWPLVRTRRQMIKVVDAIGDQPGVVLYTLVSPELETELLAGCRKLNMPCVNVLGSVMTTLSAYLGVASGHTPGRQHVLDEDYFARIDAMQFALTHDDGQSLHDIDTADVILLGVSRSSKTPTCIYLANRGVKAANVPIVPEFALPQEVVDAKVPLIVGLTTSPDRLVQIRRNRLRELMEERHSDYADPELVRDEVRAARQLYSKHGWPVIDVSRRSIEETATAILALQRERLGLG